MDVKSIEVLFPDYQLQVKFETTVELADGSLMATGLHRQVFIPGDDVSDQPDEVQVLAKLLWST